MIFCLGLDMNIRSVTGFQSLIDPLPPSVFQDLRRLFEQARADFGRAGFPVQTTRVATQPFPEIAPRDLAAFARALVDACKANGIDYPALGGARADHRLAPLDLLEDLPAALAVSDSIFAAVQVASRENGINLRAVDATARVIRRLADAFPDGFGNFRFTALANCPPHSPFFPAAYQAGTIPAFAIATEGAALAVDAFTRAHNLDEGRANLVAAVEQTSRALANVADALAARLGWQFAGIDFSLAPSPEMDASIGAAIEKLTGAPFGAHGTLFAVGLITDALQRAHFPRTGFSGVMLPVLEDPVLARRSDSYSLDSLLLYSAVCGTGLDTIPLPGDTTVDALAAILLDLATLAVKLDKPLTARLIPIQGLVAGDETKFNFEFISNARVMSPRAKGPLRFFDSDTQVEFKSKT